MNPSEKLEAGVCLTGFYFAELGMGADRFWLYNVLLNRVWELKGLNLQCVKYIYVCVYICICVYVS